MSYRSSSQGPALAYELNLSDVSALDESPPLPPTDRRRRFLASQAFMWALQGVPAVHFHSLLGTPNHPSGLSPNRPLGS